MWRVVCVILVVLLTGAGAASADGPVKIGVLLPYSGVFAVIGADITDGFEFGLARYRARSGRSFELFKEDTEVKPTVGLTKAKKLVYRDEVDLLVGPVGSNVANALRDFVHGAEIPLIIPNAGNNLLTGERCSKWILRTSFSNAQVTRGMGPWMVAHGYERVYLMAPDYAAGHQMMDAFRETFTAAGGTVVGEAYPSLRETRDYGPYLAQVKAAAPQAMFVFFAGGPAIQFVKQYAEFGLKDTIKLAGAGWLTSPLYIDEQGPAAADVLGILNYVPSIETPENIEFQLAFQNMFGRVASEFAVQGYDTARLIIEALALREGNVKNRAALVAAMHKVTFTGPRGALRIDPATNNIIQDIHIFETRAAGGKVRAVVIDTLPAMQDPPKGCRL
jgi:branched-chain amino acid transport system substrate-binding protein